MHSKNLLLFIVLFSSFLVQLHAQDKPNKKEILKSLRLTNQYFMSKWPDPGTPIVTNKERPSNIWTRAVYYEGLMALYAIYPQQAYYNYAVEWGSKHNWGLRSGTTTRNADDQCSGQTYIDLYNIDRQPERIRDIKAAIDNMVQSDKNDDWSWIDAIQMAMPVFAKLGALYNDTGYYHKMYDLYSYAKYKQGDSGLYQIQVGRDI